MSHTQGALYTVWGDSHLEELERSISALHKVHPSMPVTVRTMLNVPTKLAELATEIPLLSLEKVLDWPGKPPAPKSVLPKSWLIGSGSLPYDRTVYLDTDAYVVGILDPAFSLLERFDLVLTPDPDEIEVDGLVAPNTGVFFAARTPIVEKMLLSYRNLHHSTPGGYEGHPAEEQQTDQPAMAKVAATYNAFTWMTSPNWNFRAGSFTHLNPGKVRIIHYHGDYEPIEREVNSSIENRCWNPREMRLVR